jgi:hypothetical protein
VLGTIVAIMIGMLGRWVQDPYDVERSTGVPTLAFDPQVPLMVPTRATRTVLVAPLGDGAWAGPVAQRLAQTATARAVKATVLDLSAGGAAADINEMIGRLEQEHELVIVQLLGLVCDLAAAAFREGRPVLLVTPERRVERSWLEGAVQLLRRLDVPCAGIVMSGPGGTERLRATRSATAVATTSA